MAMARCLTLLFVLGCTLAPSSARNLVDLSDAEVESVVRQYVSQAEDYPIAPHKNQEQVARSLEEALGRHADVPVAEHVEVAWVDEAGEPSEHAVATISMLRAVETQEPQAAAAIEDSHDEHAPTARRLQAFGGVISGVTDVAVGIAQQKLEAAGQLVARAFGVFDDADRALKLDLDAQYNRTIAPLLNPIPFVNITAANAARVLVNITAVKNQILNTICQPPAVTPSKRIPTRYVGPSASLNLVPASCAIEYFRNNKTRRFTCQPARLVLNKNPAFANLAYNSSATFRGPACIFSQQFGNVTTLAFNGGEVRINLLDLKQQVTSHFLRTITALVDGDDSLPGLAGISSVVRGLTDNAVQSIVGELGTQGATLLSVLTGLSG